MQHYDTKQAADFLGLSFRTLERWRLEGDGPAYRKLGGRVLYTESDLTEFSEHCRRHNTSEGATA